MEDNEQEFEEAMPRVIPLNTAFLEVKDDSITFSVHDVKQSSSKDTDTAEQAFETAIESLKDELHHEAFVKSRKDIEEVKIPDLGKLQDCSIRHEDNSSFKFGKFRPCSVAGAIYNAYLEHNHLVLTPSDFIIMIGQGLATHINLKHDKLRHLLVNHKGQEQVKVLSPNVKLNGQSDWTQLFGVMTEEVRKRVKKDLYSILIDDTSTATQTTRIVTELKMLDCLKNYFKYDFWAGCGFPKLTLKGKPDDWQKLKDKVHALRDMNKLDHMEIDWWLKKLVPVVDKMCETGIERTVDHEFWGNMCHDYTDYGCFVTGWINVFLPYTYLKIEGFKKNCALESDLDLKRFVFINGIEMSFMNEGFSKVPFTFTDEKNIPHNMHFYSGFLGYKTRNEDGSRELAYFWSVYQDAEDVKLSSPRKAGSKDFKFNAQTSPYGLQMAKKFKLDTFFDLKPLVVKKVSPSKSPKRMLLNEANKTKPTRAESLDKTSPSKLNKTTNNKNILS